MANVRRVVLIGFSGSGKSTVARLLAARLGWSALDTDAAIEARFGTSIPAVFAAHGETAFRTAERAELAAALARDRVVVATGGGAVVDPAAWAAPLLGGPETLVVALDASPDTVLARLRRQQAAEGVAVARPMLAAADPLQRIADLKTLRQDAYDRAAITLIVDSVTADAVAADIAALVPDAHPEMEPTLCLDAPSGISEIFIASGISARLGEVTRRTWAGARRAWVITDEVVGRLHGAAIEDSLRRGGFTVATKAVKSGEGSKSLATAGDLYDWLLDGGIERGDVVAALGGGVVGDLAGFVAATCLRGVGLVQVPTSLLAMVDSSVGGKTGINHRAGKNLIGAFYQPPVVAIDPSLLRTLPHRELVSGWAEVVKHALIQPSTPGGERADLVAFLERNATRLVGLGEPATSYLIQRNVALKAAVVEADEREAGLRALLNFGHTLGHAIEAAGYRYLHGEAIAIGMRAAMRIAARLGTVGPADVDRLDALLDRFGLPSTAHVDQAAVIALLTADKKRIAGKQRWVLPRAGGGVRIVEHVPADVVRDALASVSAERRVAERMATRITI